MRNQQENANISELVDTYFPEDYLGMKSIPVSGKVGQRFEILKAYLGKNPGRNYFGKILAVLRYNETRYFKVIFHVWRPHQVSSLANRMTVICELVAQPHLGYSESYLESVETEFGKKAFWLYTPDSELDDESLELRAVAKELKAYSVKNQLCKEFRKNMQKGEKNGQ